MSGGPSGLLYRDAVTVRPQAAYVEDLLADLAASAAAPVSSAQATLLRTLLSSSILECALADVGDAGAAVVQLASDRIATALMELTAPAGAPAFGHRALDRWDRSGWSQLAASVAALRDPRPLRSSRPEGFAYYALDPLRFADQAARFLVGDAPVTVLGIRTAGVALSCLSAATLARRGRPSERLTVRPTGHPYDRRLALPEPIRQQVGRAERGGHDFLVVDEGPGLSGSSFLAVGEALMLAGVPARRITFFGTRPVDAPALVTRDPLRRWRQFRYGCAPPGQSWLQPGERDLSGGRWRAVLIDGSPSLPPAWPAGERLKALSADGQVLRKFEGLARHGAAAFRRAAALAEAGLAPTPLGPPSAAGFVRYQFVPGRPLSLADRTPALCVQLGRYIAARPRLCPADGVDPLADNGLAELLSTNVSLVLERPWTPSRLPTCVRPAVVDGRLAPHEWIAGSNGRLIKVDAASHGDDHFFPGPTDIAWDLAGAIVEWDLSAADRDLLLDSYRRAAGDDPGDRLPVYLLAYAAFRARMAALCARTGNAEEAARWRQLEQHYTRVVKEEVQAWER